MKKFFSFLICMAILLTSLASLAACKGTDEECEHEYGEWTVTQDATCTSEGIRKRKCDNCSDRDTQSFSKLAHDYENGICSMCNGIDPTYEGDIPSGEEDTSGGSNTPNIPDYPDHSQEELDVSYDGSEVEITFYHTMSATRFQPILDKYIEEFNTMYPNIKITHMSLGSYDDLRQALTAELTVGDQPNIAYCYPEHIALYNRGGAVLTLDGYINSTSTITDALGNTTISGLTAEQKDDFIDGFYERGRVFGDGKMYSLPMSMSTEVLYYNKTFFDEHGLTVPETWDEMEEICRIIKEIYPDSIPLGYDSEANWFITMCEQLETPYTSATGEHFLFDNDTNREFVKRLSEWYAKGYVTTQEIYGCYTSDLFASGGSFMSIASSGGATYNLPSKDSTTGEYLFEVGIAPIPQINPEEPKVISLGPSLCMFKGFSSNETAATWLFMKYLTTCAEFQAEFSIAAGYVPVIESAAQTDKYTAYLAQADGGRNIVALCTKVCLEQKDSYFAPPAFDGSSVARDQVGLLLSYCMVNYKKDGSDQENHEMIDNAFAKAKQECEYFS